MTTRVPRVFVASSGEGLPYARVLRRLLKPELEAVLWEEDFFSLGQFTLEALVENSREFDGAIVLATADDRVISRQRESDAPRDNLIFEFGLFVSLFGQKRALLLVEATTTRLPSDLGGLTYAPFERTQPLSRGLRAASRGIKTVATKWRDHPIDRIWRERVSRLLQLSLNELQDRSGITTDLGLHVFLVDNGTVPAQLVRVARQRLGPKSAKPWSPFVEGVGIVGTCWQRAESVFVDFTDPALFSADQDRWLQRETSERFGMDFELLRLSRTRYKAVGAVPITSFGSGVVGCISYNLGQNSEADPRVLQRPAVVRVLDTCAEVMAIVLGS